MAGKMAGAKRVLGDCATTIPKLHLAYRHVYFEEFSEAVASSLKKQGFQVSLSRSLKSHRADVVVAVGIHLFMYVPLRRRFRLIGIQTEQLASAGSLERRLVRNRARFECVYKDYDLVVDWIPRLHVEGQPFLPYGCAMVSRVECDKEFDVCFIGNVHGNRRERILSELRQEFNFFPDFSPGFGEAKREAIRKSRILLNLKFYQDGGFETPRMFDYLSSGAFVLSEFSECTAPFVPGRDFVQFRDEQELRQLLRYYLSNAQARELVANSGYAVSQQYTWDHVSQMLLQMIHDCRRKSLGRHYQDWFSSRFRCSVFQARDGLSQLRRMWRGATK